MYSKVLVAVDLQDIPGCEATLQSLTNYITPDMDIELMSVLPGVSMPMVSSYFPDDMVQKALTTMRSELTKIADSHIPKEFDVSVWVSSGKAPKQIVQRASETGADLILIRALKHGRMEKVMMGSVTAKVVQAADCAVLVMR